MALQWFEVMRKCGDEVRKLLRLGDAPFGYVNVFTSHINVGSSTAPGYRIRPAGCKAPATSCAVRAETGNGHIRCSAMGLIAPDHARRHTTTPAHGRSQITPFEFVARTGL
jgi:hypothetical protein